MGSGQEIRIGISRFFAAGLAKQLNTTQVYLGPPNYCALGGPAFTAQISCLQIYRTLFFQSTSQAGWISDYGTVDETS